jgi:hypothetical protein
MQVWKVVVRTNTPSVREVFTYIVPAESALEARKNIVQLPYWNDGLTATEIEIEQVVLDQAVLVSYASWETVYENDW